jgi:hypothetical protein
MKYFIRLLIFILCLNSVQAQNNLILNASFEQVIGCPNVNLGAITENYVPSISNPANYTPDYFNSCYFFQGVPYLATPSNVRGYQFAKTGTSYAGLDLWERNAPARDYVQIRLKETLKPNHHYAFECYLSRAEKFRYAVSNLGAYFSVDSISMPTTDILSFVPQINNPAGNYFTDTLNWMPFTGTFLAQGGEQYVILGNFNPASAPIDTLYQYYGSASHSNWAYYYIDDVSLIDLDSTLSVKENEAMAQVEVFPNPAQESINLSGIAVQDHNNVLVSITDITGKLVKQTKLNSNVPIDVSQLNAGLYFIYLESSKGKQMAKFVKE